MTLPRTAAEVLSDHVVFQIESIDRMLLHVYQPRLQYAPGVMNLFTYRGHGFASSALTSRSLAAWPVDGCALPLGRCMRDTSRHLPAGCRSCTLSCRCRSCGYVSVS